MSTPTSPEAASSSLTRTTMRLAVDIVDDAAAMRGDDGAGVDARRCVRCRCRRRAFRTQAGHRLALHVRAHQRAVGVVVLEEGISEAATETIWLGATSM